MPETKEFHMAIIRAGLTQMELAASLGLHPSTVSRIVCGWQVPSEEIQEAIRKALGNAGRKIRFGYRIRCCNSQRG